MLEPRLEKHVDFLIERYPVLEKCREDIIKAYLVMEECYTRDGKLMIAGNGGSAADSEHIAGELMKRFKIARTVPAEFAEKLKEVSTEDLRSALEPSAKELSEFDLQGKVFSSMDTLIQDVRQILREFCESRIKEMRDFIDASVPAEPDRADGIKLLEDEINKERSSADAMDKYIQNELPGYPAELKLRQELEK